MQKSEILQLHFSYARETKQFYVYEIAQAEKELFYPGKIYLSKKEMKTNLPKIELIFYSGE